MFIHVILTLTLLLNARDSRVKFRTLHRLHGQRAELEFSRRSVCLQQQAPPSVLGMATGLARGQVHAHLTQMVH